MGNSKYYLGFIKSDKSYEENVKLLKEKSTNALFAYKENDPDLYPVQDHNLPEFPVPVDFYEAVSINSETFMVTKPIQTGGLALFSTAYAEQFTPLYFIFYLKIVGYWYWYKRKFASWFLWNI